MALLKDAKSKTDEEITNSGYWRMSKNIDMARLFQQIQSTVIRNGNELEELVFRDSHIRGRVKQEYTDVDLEDAPCLYYKTTLKEGIIPGLEKSVHPDFIVVTHDSVSVVELKDGNNFDTKKSTGEIDKLEMITAFLQQHTSKKVKGLIVLWNTEDLGNASFKDKRASRHLMTGREFADLVGIDFDALNKSREADAQKNEHAILTLTKRIIEKYEVENETLL
jgi:hypothetical protein